MVRIGIFNKILKLFHIVGDLIEDTNVYVLFYWIFLKIMLVLFLFIETGVVLRKLSGFSEATQILCIYQIHLIILYKNIDMFIKGRKFRKIIDELLEDSFDATDAMLETRVNLTAKSLDRLLYTLSAIAVLSLSLFLALSLKNSQNEGFGMYLVFFRETPTVAFTFIYGFIILVYFYFSYLLILTDVLITTLISCIGLRFEILSSAAKNFFNGLNPARRNTKEIHARIEEFVKQHWKLIRITHDLNSLISLPMAIQLFLSVILICFVAFQSAKADGNHLYFLTMMQYLSYNIIQLFLYCNGGQIILDNSVQISASLYQSNWTEFTNIKEVVDFIKLVCFRSQYSIQLKAGWFYNLNRETFMMILRTSYSLLTFLLNVS